MENVIEFAVCLETKDEISAELIRRRLEKSYELIDREPVVISKSGNREREQFISLMEKYCDLTNKEKVERICSELKISRATFYRRQKKYY